VRESSLLLPNFAQPRRRYANEGTKEILDSAFGTAGNYFSEPAIELSFLADATCAEVMRKLGSGAAIIRPRRCSNPSWPRPAFYFPGPSNDRRLRHRHAVGARPLFSGVSVKFGSANGCGKPTFVKIPGGELEPSAGSLANESD